MRLEMRGVVGLAVAVPLLVVSVSCCKLCLPHTIGDEVSGEPNGSALVKVLVTLKDDADRNCTAQVAPPRVIVFRGSAIRWRVVNNCSRPSSSFLRFTRPTPLRAKDGDPEAPRPWDYRFCTGQIANLYAEKDERNVLFCEVPETVVPGLYKYGLDGAAKKDPEIEVRKGGGK